MKHSVSILFSLILLIACGNEMETEQNLDSQTIVDQLAANYVQMPEKAITISLDSNVYAQYAMPTEKYGHGVLGDKIEAGQLVVVEDGVFYEHTLPGDYLYEDIRPRLYDVDGDNQLEIITIRTDVSKGAGIVIYKILNKRLSEYAYVPEIGESFKWLNIVTIEDLDNDGIVELVWIQTPHIGGILKVAKIKEGTLEVLDTETQYSNHQGGERNMCLSILTEQSAQKIFYVPNQSRDKIVGFTFENNQLNAFEEINQLVDFSRPLSSQYDFINPIEDAINCIDVE